MRVLHLCKLEKSSLLFVLIGIWAKVTMNGSIELA